MYLGPLKIGFYNLSSDNFFISQFYSNVIKYITQKFRRGIKMQWGW